MDPFMLPYIFLFYSSSSTPSPPLSASSSFLLISLRRWTNGVVKNTDPRDRLPGVQILVVYFYLRQKASVFSSAKWR